MPLDINILVLNGQQAKDNQPLLILFISYVTVISDTLMLLQFLLVCKVFHREYWRPIVLKVIKNFSVHVCENS